MAVTTDVANAARRLRRTISSARMARRKRKVLEEGAAPASWYDETYKRTGKYQTHWSESAYLPVWTSICDRIPRDARILEIGCGPGQLAQMLRDRELGHSYVGFDFSEAAIDMARAASPALRFEVADAYTTDLLDSSDYDLVICTEVLEHLTDDLGILDRVRAGVQVLATVPDFDFDSHVRFFADEEAVRERYARFFSSLDISLHHHSGDRDGHNGTFFLMDGTRATSE